MLRIANSLRILPEPFACASVITENEMEAYVSCTVPNDVCHTSQLVPNFPVIGNPGTYWRPGVYLYVLPKAPSVYWKPGFNLELGVY